MKKFNRFAARLFSLKGIGSVLFFLILSGCGASGGFTFGSNCNGEGSASEESFNFDLTTCNVNGTFDGDLGGVGFGSDDFN